MCFLVRIHTHIKLLRVSGFCAPRIVNAWHSIKIVWHSFVVWARVGPNIFICHRKSLGPEQLVCFIDCFWNSKFDNKYRSVSAIINLSSVYWFIATLGKAKHIWPETLSVSEKQSRTLFGKFDWGSDQFGDDHNKFSRKQKYKKKNTKRCRAHEQMQLYGIAAKVPNPYRLGLELSRPMQNGKIKWVDTWTECNGSYYQVVHHLTVCVVVFCPFF